MVQRNKVGLLFLESVKENLDFGLRQEHERQLELQIQQRATVKRSSQALEEAHVDFVVFKNPTDFPYVANDVDILVLGDKASYRNATLALLKYGFKQVEQAPLEMCFHDGTRAKHPVMGKKDVYDVDLYREIGVSWLIYLNKRLFAAQVTRKRISGIEIPVFKSEVELLATIFHSVFPEQLYTLSHYYSVLYTFSRMTDEELVRFVGLSRSQRTDYAVDLVLRLTALLHSEAHGFIPQQLEKVIYNASSRLDPTISLSMPYRFRIEEVIRTLLEKTGEREFRHSTFSQIFNTLKPKTLKYLLKEGTFRRLRETY